MGVRKQLGIGLLGLGTVGSGVARILPTKGEALFSHLGASLIIRRVLVRDPAKPRPVRLDPALLTTNPADVLDDPEVDIVVEVIGGEDPALRFLERAIANGKHVVTANKEVIAKHGPELLRAAAAQGVAVKYEASVGGGIPIIAVFQHDLSANEIREIRAIINGTTNYILTKMAVDGSDFETALAEAQALGYAEPDPAADIDGHDAAYKLAILSSLGFHADIRPHQVFREGIRRLSARDFKYAADLGYAIKLLAIGRNTARGIEVRVHPTLIPRDQLLAKVDGVFNGIEVEGDLVGRLMLYGRGAGAEPTTSAVVADVVDLVQNLVRGVSPASTEPPRRPVVVIPMDHVSSRFYLRLIVADRAGVLAQIAREFGDHAISIASVIQVAADADAGTAELVVMTHRASESAMQQTVAAIARLPVVATVASFLRVEE
ncbi:MAG: homoserine dehydrogenase [Chloroflexota bacterium]|nr:homoserine dehydrogenase [Dehalococcoidia bacterium]MDW8253058.1 homoserine dehydrogenase [Chloroflexota bacterium]